MPKKPVGSKKPVGAKKPAGDDRVASVVLKTSKEYRDWLSGISKESLIPVASIVRDALAKWAAGRGYPAPPER